MFDGWSLSQTIWITKYKMPRLRQLQASAEWLREDKVVNRLNIGLKLCRRNKHEAVVNLKDFYLYIHNTCILKHLAKQLQKSVVYQTLSLKSLLLRDCATHFINGLFLCLNGILRLYPIRPCRAAEKLKGFYFIPFFLQQLLEHRAPKSLITFGAVDREVIAYFVKAGPTTEGKRLFCVQL